MRGAAVSQIFALSAGLLLVAPHRSLAQAPATTLEDLGRRVAPGAAITVTDQAGRDAKGTLIRLSPTQLVLKQDGRERTFPAETLAEVRHRQRDSLANGMLIGAAIGAVPFIFLNVSSWCSDEGPNCGGGYAWSAFYFGLGLGAGAALDALRTKQILVYQRPSLTFGLRPVVSRGGWGGALTIRF
jgi:hypothetical protein